MRRVGRKGRGSGGEEDRDGAKASIREGAGGRRAVGGGSWEVGGERWREKVRENGEAGREVVTNGRGGPSTLARMMAHGRRSESLTEMCCQSYCESM